MNAIQIVGRLGDDAIMKMTKTDKSIVTFKVADDYGFGDNKKVNWWNCNLWGNLGPAIIDRLTKGIEITVFGNIETNEWQDKDGNKRSDKVINVRDVKIHGGKNDVVAKPKSDGTPASSKSPDVPFSDEDIPF